MKKIFPILFLTLSLSSNSFARCSDIGDRCVQEGQIACKLSSSFCSYSGYCKSLVEGCIAITCTISSGNTSEYCGPEEVPVR